MSGEQERIVSMSMFASSVDYWKSQAEAWQAQAEADMIEIMRLRLEVAAKQQQINGFYAGTADSRLLAMTLERDQLRKDAERYRKLEAAATEQLLHPDRARCEMMPDRRTHWKLPVLMCSGPVGGFVSFADAVDALPPEVKP